MKWPRGKYNGKRIVGVRFAVHIDVRQWLWRPLVLWRCCGGVHWLCIRTFTGWEFE